MTHLQLLALVITYSGNTEKRCEPGFSVDTFYINKFNLCYPFLPHLGVLAGVKANLRLLTLVIMYSATLRYDIILISALVFLHKYMSILLPLFITPFGVAIRGKANILALVSAHSEKPKIRYISDFNLGPFCYPLFTNFGVAVRGKASFKIACIGHSVLGEPQGTI